jgi:YVTN family beta-propeller protein
MKILTHFLFASAILLGASLTSPALIAGLDPLKSFDLVASQFLGDPARHLIYASITGSNEIAVIDTGTLTVTQTIPIGSAPVGMAMMPDGSKLYVALSGSTSIGIINLPSLTTGTPLAIAQKPYQIAVGLADRLYVSAASNGGVLQVNATTGATEATLIGLNYDKLLQISADQTSLFVGDIGISGSTLQRYDVSTATPMLVQTANDTGENGEDLKLSHTGEFICYPNGGGNTTTYATDLLNPNDLNVIYGSLQVGAYPGPMTFSQDDAVAYEANVGLDHSIDLFDTTSFLQFASFTLPATQFGQVFDLITSGEDRYLFVADEEAIRVYDPAADTTSSETATVGKQFSFQTPIYIHASSIDVAGLPNGLAFDETTQTISGVPTENGNFTIVVTASDGKNTVSSTLNLTLFPDSHAQNISTRADVQTGDDVLIAGFIVTGSEETHALKQVIIRAIGPSLTVEGQPLAGRLMNPNLQVYDSTGVVIVSNDDWQDDFNTDTLLGYGLAPSDPAEAATVLGLAPGAYTVIVSGVGGTTGIGLVELYDIDTEDAVTAMGGARLANISTRGHVETGDNVMIGGFIVGPSDAANMLLRAIGPSLADQKVTGVLDDPQLTLYNAQGTVIGSNDNWRDTQEAEIEASGIAPTDDRESAISISLEPGGYTAIVGGVDGTTGVALVEAYNLP